MGVWLDWLLAVLAGIPALFVNPITYLLLIIIALQWKRQVDMERKLFSTRLHTVAEGLFQSVFYGVLGGLLVSCLCIGLGVFFDLEPFYYLWTIAIILSLLHIRYFCFAYAGAILGIAVLVVRWLPQEPEIPLLHTIWTSLHSIYLPSLFIMVAFMHLIEALLVYLTGGKRGTPIFIQSKRGRLVGAYHIQHIWFIPLFLVTEGGEQVFAPLFSGWPLFAPEMAGGFSLVLLPAVLGYSEQAVSSFPQEKARYSAAYLLVYSLLLAGITISAVYVHPGFIIAAILFSFLGHESMLWLSRWKEEQKTPIYVHPAQGLKILAVIPHSPAAKMGLKAGEVIVKVNGTEVKRRKELYQALTSNLAFCKLEVINLEGNLKFAKRSLYAEDHHQLGVILAPDQETPYYLQQKSVNLIQLMKQKIDRKSNNNSLEA